MLEPKLEIDRLEMSVRELEERGIVPGKIVFYGDSAFTRWSPKYGMKSLEEEIRFPDGSRAVVNQGFGGSTAEEQLYYYDRLIRPWKPRALVLLTFGNDNDVNYSPEEILFLQSRIINYAKADFPGIRIFLCNHRPFALYSDTMPGIRKAVYQYNELLASYAAIHKDVTLVDLFHDPRFYVSEAEAGNIKATREDIFIKDRVHFNDAGYEIFKDIFVNVLGDLLQEKSE
ncbi:MAG: hypothetical protein IK088_09625 [Lachnospiraceae bacterium]|nr:hypothetical protein [Lachnospiraceae bacterium]